MSIASIRRLLHLARALLLRHSGLDSSPRTAQQRLRHAQNNPASVNAWDACWNFKNFAPAAPKFPKPQHAPTHCACRSRCGQVEKMNPRMKFRYARHTNNLVSIIEFYTEIIGLEIIGQFENHSN